MYLINEITTLTDKPFLFLILAFGNFNSHMRVLPLCNQICNYVTFINWTNLRSNLALALLHIENGINLKQYLF